MDMNIISKQDAATAEQIVISGEAIVQHAISQAQSAVLAKLNLDEQGKLIMDAIMLSARVKQMDEGKRTSKHLNEMLSVICHHADSALSDALCSFGEHGNEQQKAVAINVMNQLGFED